MLTTFVCFIYIYIDLIRISVIHRMDSMVVCMCIQCMVHPLFGWIFFTKCHFVTLYYSPFVQCPLQCIVSLCCLNGRVHVFSMSNYNVSFLYLTNTIVVHIDYAIRMLLCVYSHTHTQTHIWPVVASCTLCDACTLEVKLAIAVVSYITLV